LRGQAARNESRRLFAETRAYQVTYKRCRALDQDVFEMLKSIRELEDDPTLKLDHTSKLDEAMREATLSDDPGKLKECLDSLGNPHLYKREAERMIQARGELVIKDLKERIKQCTEGRKEQLKAEKEAEKQARKEEAPAEEKGEPPTSPVK